MPTETTARTLELTEFEKIVPRGVHKQTWSVKLDGRWVSAQKAPGAIVVDRPSQPGVVWQKQVQLQLRPGAQVRLTTQSPRSPAKPRDVFSVITIDARSRTKVRQDEFYVTPDGRLERPNSK